jgi:hypothetical protein
MMTDWTLAAFTVNYYWHWYSIDLLLLGDYSDSSHEIDKKFSFNAFFLLYNPAYTVRSTSTTTAASTKP